MRNLEGIQKYLSLSVKLILFLSIFNSIYNHLWHLASTSIFLLVLLFLPQIITKYEIKIPQEFEWFLLVFSIVTLFLGKTGGIVTPIVFGIAIAMIGFMILSILYSSNQIKKNVFLIIAFSFNFAVAFGFALELLKYYLKIILNQPFSSDLYVYSMQTMSFVIIGALISSFLGYLYMQNYSKTLRNFVKRIMEKNPKIFLKSELLEEEILELIKKGEDEKTEFKSTLRMNLHTHEIDKKMEFSSLKTIVAFLNSNGGNLLIGIENYGEIIGIEKDKFENTDRYLLYLTNIIKTRIGKQILPLIEFKFLNIKEKKILRIDCKKSNTPIFIRNQNNDEEFYIRTGPSSIQMKGSELIDYIGKRFEKK